MSVSPDPRRVTALPQLIEDLFANRQRIQEAGRGVKAALEALSARLAAYSLVGSDPSTHELARLDGTSDARHEELAGQLARLFEAAAKWREAERERVTLVAELKDGEAGRAQAMAEVRAIEGEWWGIRFLQNWFDGSHARRLQEGRLRVEIGDRRCRDLTERLQSAKVKWSSLAELADRLKKGCAASLEACRPEVDQHFDQLMDQNSVEWRAVYDQLPPFFRCDWSGSEWEDYELSLCCRVPYWVGGIVVEAARGARQEIRVPYLLPLLGSHRTTRIVGASEASMSLLQGLVLQLATMMPYGASFTLLDPSGAGRAFPMKGGLPFVRPLGVDIAHDLNSVLLDIHRVIETYIDEETKSFEQLPEQIQSNERYEFVVAANFPEGYDRVSIEILQKIARNGPTAGRYLFLHCSRQLELPHGLSWNDFGELVQVDMDRGAQVGPWRGGRIEWLRTAAGAAQRVVLQRLAEARPPENNVDWTSVIPADPSEWWRQTSATLVETPIGVSGPHRPLSVWFGVKAGRPCAHGILAAISGVGKSNLYHVLINGLATRYSPREIELYLIDGKMGVEFQSYRALPHARVVSLHSAPELSRSVLSELVLEMARRNELFARAGVVDLPGYRNLALAGTVLPRIILMIDEYQQLFEEDRYGQASAHLLSLAQQGRSAGIHLLLGSQRFGAPGMLNQTAVFGSMHLRMAMQMSQPDVQALTEFGRNGRRMVEQCDRPGKIVVNSNSGDDTANEFGKVAFLEAAQRNSLPGILQRKAEQELAPQWVPSTVVFDGREQPNFLENPQVSFITRRDDRPDAQEWREFATSPVHLRGLGVLDWYEGEHPLAIWLGQELNVHGQARMVLRRRAMENALVLGDNMNAIYGMLAAILCSVAISARPTQVRLSIVDRAIRGTPWEKVLEGVALGLLTPRGYAVDYSRDPAHASAWLEAADAEIARRETMPEAHLPEQTDWIVVLAGADHLPRLRRVTGSYGTPSEGPDGEMFRRVCTKGPLLGIHVIVGFSAGSAMKGCLDRSHLDAFKHRIATQVGDTDSVLLLGNDRAARLQRGDAQPIYAIYADETSGVATRFKPYVANAQIPWDDQLIELEARLRKWTEETYVNG